MNSWPQLFRVYIYISGQIITTSADVTLNGGLIRELPQNPLNSGLGIILICPDIYIYIYLEPKTTIYKWLFQLVDCKSLDRKWLFHQTSILNWLFRVPGIYIYKGKEGYVGSSICFYVCYWSYVYYWYYVQYLLAIDHFNKLYHLSSGITTCKGKKTPGKRSWTLIHIDIINASTPPENQHVPWKMMVGRLFSRWHVNFPGGVLEVRHEFFLIPKDHGMS